MRKLCALRFTLYATGALFILSVISGCVVRTYKITKDRADQDLTAGNRGYVSGQVPAEEKPRKATRTTQAIEIELRSPLKFEKMPKEKVYEEKAAAFPEEEAAGNLGFVEQSIEPDILEPGMLNYEKYTVEKNDTLQKISQKFYGTTKKWTKIYDANKDVLKGPNKIYPGQVINIPVEAVAGTQGKIK